MAGVVCVLSCVKWNLKSSFYCKNGSSQFRYLGLSTTLSQQHEAEESKEAFRVLDLKKKKVRAAVKRKMRKAPILPPRSTQMPVDQDWPSVWPGPRSFHPATVPLPLRQGFVEKDAPPGKFANAELMKIPNFLHLTPPAIKRHCEALKKFCTPWPRALDTEEMCEKHFPVEVIATDYCHSSPVIRNPLSRIVTLKVKLSKLTLDSHARDKFLRLVGDRYNPKTDVVTIVTERCPLRGQNYDYGIYLLTALFHESWTVEPWESEKSLADMEYFDWETSQSRRSIISLLTLCQSDKDEQPDEAEPSKVAEVLGTEDVMSYSESVTNIMNKGEDEYTINSYKESAKKLLNLPKKNPIIGQEV